MRLQYYHRPICLRFFVLKIPNGHFINENLFMNTVNYNRFTLMRICTQFLTLKLPKGLSERSIVLRKLSSDWLKQLDLIILTNQTDSLHKKFERLESP